MLNRHAPSEETQRAAPNPVISHARAAESGTESMMLYAQRGVKSASVLDTPVSGTGETLPAATRAFFEPRLGHDFSRVRIHADTAAGNSAQALGAQAFTLVRDVVFGFGHYAPQSAAGQRLLAHELTHVVQQASDGERIQRKPLYVDSAWATHVAAARTDTDKLALYSLPDVKSKAIELIVSAASTEPKKTQLHKLAQQLTGGNIVGAPNDFKRDLLAAL